MRPRCIVTLLLIGCGGGSADPEDPAALQLVTTTTGEDAVLTGTPSRSTETLPLP